MGSTSVPPPAADVMPGEVERDPDFWLRWVSWLVVVFSAAQILLFSFGREQSAYAVVASQLLQGDLPYQDVWEAQPPGIFWIYAASFAAFAKTMAAPRAIEVLFLIGVVLGCRRLGGVLFQSRTAGLLGGAIAALVHAQLDFWHSGQPENFGGALTLFALVLTTHPWSRRRAPLGWLSVGTLFGLAALFVPYLAAGAAVCAVFLFVRRKQDEYSTIQAALPSLAIAGGLGMILGLCALWLGILGVLDDAWWTLVNYSSGEVKAAWADDSPPRLLFRTVQKGLFDYSGLFTAGVIASAALHPRADNERQGLLLILGVVSLHLAGVAVQGRLTAHDFATNIPLLGLVSGHGMYKLWRRIGPGSMPGTLAFVAFLSLLPAVRMPVEDLPGGFWERSRIRVSYLLGAGRTISREELDRRLYFNEQYRLDDVREATRFLARTFPPSSSIYVWGFEPGIYWLSGMEPASRFVHNLPQMGHWHRHRLRRQLLKELAASPPDVLVVQKNPMTRTATGNPKQSTSETGFPELESFLAQSFEAKEPVGDFTFWIRKQ